MQYKNTPYNTFYFNSRTHACSPIYNSAEFEYVKTVLTPNLFIESVFIGLINRFVCACVRVRALIPISFISYKMSLHHHVKMFLVMNKVERKGICANFIMSKPKIPQIKHTVISHWMHV